MHHGDIHTTILDGKFDVELYVKENDRTHICLKGCTD